jgi:general secretion pathway protein G
MFSGRKPGEFTPPEEQALRAQAQGENGAAVAVAVVAGLFLFIALAGIIAAVAVPNFLNAVQRGKQKRTIADMRAVAAAIEAYATDNNYYPDATTIDELARTLEPSYIRAMPRADGWGRPLKYEAWLEGEDDDLPTTYALGSAGKDGAWERQDLIDTPETRTTGYGADLVLVNGAFVQLPEGEDPGWVERPTDVPPESPPEQEPETPALRS